MQCPNCGQVAREKTRFCGRCGRELPVDEAAPGAASASRPEAADDSAVSAPNGAAPTPWGAPPTSPGSAPAAAPPAGTYAPTGYSPSPSYPPPGSPYAPPGAYGPPPGSPYAPPGYGYGQYSGPRTNGLAVTALILGCVGWLICGIGSVVAIVLGLVARGQIRNSGGRETGDGMALAGVILGSVFTALWVTYFVIAVIVSARNGGS